MSKVSLTVTAITCGECSQDFYGKMSHFVHVKTGGETWEEECPYCHTRYRAELWFKQQEDE